MRLILSQRVAVDEIAGMNGMLLHQNVPNPTDGTTTIRFELAQPRTVALELRDLQGRLIQSIEAGRLPAGEHSSTFDVSGLQAGIYSYTLVADGMRGGRCGGLGRRWPIRWRPSARSSVG